MNKNEIVLFETADNEVALQVQMQEETVWLTQAQMVELYGRDISVISRHINNVFNEARIKEFNDSDDYILMPECPGMSYEEAAVVIKWWCRQNGIPYNDDMDNIDAAYRWYYKLDTYEDTIDDA